MSNFKKIIRIYTQPAFLICVIILAVAGSGMSYAIKSFGVYLKKEPFPIRKSLDLLDENGLGPYKVIDKRKIENPHVVEELGTQEYIKWVLKDTEVSDKSLTRFCFLFITYYDLPDRVPHVPEECYSGAGHQRLASDSLEVDIGEKQIPMRYLVFTRTDGDQWTSLRFPVLYTFNVNGEYAGTREGARKALNKNIFGKYSYFCKVEWNFFNIRNNTRIYPGKDEVILASEKLFRTILPILEKEHWPIADK